MIDVLNWIADHAVGAILFLAVVGLILEGVVEAGRRK